VKLCRAGKLFAIEQWIAEGRSLEVPATKTLKNKTLLQIAIQTGFHSLVELIARHESHQSTKNVSLKDAVDARRLDLVELLVESGAEVSSVPLAEVLLTWEPRIIQFFLEHGADPLSDSPFAAAFGARVRTALRPYVEWKKAHPEQSSVLQEQADRALRSFAYEGDLKWVSLLLWAGADARSIGPALGEEHDDPEAYSSALKQACYAGKLEIVKRFKPEAGKDDLSDLLHCAAVSGKKDLIGYFLNLGASPNDKPNGGSSAIDSVLWRLAFGMAPYGGASMRSSFGAYEVLECAGVLAHQGAVWNPNGEGDFQALRRMLYAFEARVTIEILRLLLAHGACPIERAEELIRTPRMKQHLARETWHLSRLGLVRREKGDQKRLPIAGHLLVRFNREELFAKVWAQPMRNVAKQYGVSDVWLAKVCRALKVPVPGRGYWAKLQAGCPTGKIPRLPALSQSRTNKSANRP
jgi:hypothetical protein